MLTRVRRVLVGAITICTAIAANSCGSRAYDVCGCTPSRPASVDFRHAQKHIPIPNITPLDTTVTDILTWPVDTSITDATPRSGRELKVYRVVAYLQFVRVVRGDCDIHLEISAVPDKNAPRMIVETPVDSEYCPARLRIQSQLLFHGISLNPTGKDINPAIKATIVGMGFQDFEHDRGTPQVATMWELHPAIVTIH